MIGWEQPSRLVLSKRRWMRRLLDFNLRCMMVFTRNPSRRPVLEKTATLLDAGTAEGFRFSHKFHPANPRIFACLRARSCSPLLESEGRFPSAFGDESMD